MYYIGEESAYGDDFKEMRKENSKFWKEVMTEDVLAVEGMQAGRASPVYDGGNFSPVVLSLNLVMKCLAINFEISSAP